MQFLDQFPYLQKALYITILIISGVGFELLQLGIGYYNLKKTKNKSLNFAPKLEDDFIN